MILKDNKNNAEYIFSCTT